ncbi:hypothetical protein U9M48_007805 [Paspalum notatum var. saurae]|uniref:Uncharacterized protein n=1 Tax=Paspalum notatum var. saurae TaxID=547442 RepID=A0AAQ3WC60_PASNO
MANDVSPRGRAGRRRCVSLTRVDLLTFLLAAALCSASYCLGIWHNSRGATDSRVLLGPSAAVPSAGATSCGGDPDEPLDFEAHHAAESAGLSVSASTSTGARRALRSAAPEGTESAGGKRWAAPARGHGGSLRFTGAVAVQA